MHCSVCSSDATTCAQVEAAGKRLQAALAVCDVPAARSRLAVMEQEAAQGELWADAARAQALLSRIASVK